jgi:aldehyde dehydrogenase (NAD+)
MAATGQLNDAPLYIDGAFREARSGRRFDVINPADETVCGTAADAGAPDVAGAVEAARRAFDTTGWWLDHELRHRCMVQLQQSLARQADRICATLQAEAGTPAGVLGPSATGPVSDMTFTNDLIKTLDWETDFPAFEMLGMRSSRRVRREPYGVTAAITTWNSPFVFALVKVSGALSAGNTVVLKTPADTPLTGALIAEAIHTDTDIPPGVFNLISSADTAAAGEALTGDPRVDMFHFTGSVAVGQRIMERAAVGIRKVVLELGGKSANIILPDADLAAASAIGANMCMINSGQGCLLPTRMVVHASVYDEMMDRLTAAFAAISWGDPRDPANAVGPLIRPGQVDRVAGLVDRARAVGASIPVGGQRATLNGKGYYYEPTLVTGVAEDSEIAQTEVFGPVLTVLRYDGDDDEAIRVANSTPYGLSSYIQTTDPERAWYVASRLRAGTVNIGASFHQSPQTPFGGYGVSGLGREGGVEGFLEFLQSKTVSTPA